jgi:hypothetical protein
MRERNAELTEATLDDAKASTTHMKLAEAQRCAR